MNATSWIRRRSAGLLLGLGAAGAGCAAFLCGAFNGIDHFSLDVHFRRFGSVAADGRIVLIDIDDRTIESMPEWPWPRRRYAQIVDTLRELGAASIVLDLILSEPMPPRVEHAGLGRHYDVDVATPERGDRAADPVIYDDDELVEAMARAGHVYLAMIARIEPPGLDSAAVRDRAVEVVRSAAGRSLDSFRRQMGAGFSTPVDDLYPWSHVVRAIEEAFDTDGDDVIASLAAIPDIDSDRARAAIPDARRYVADRVARRFLDNDNDSSARWPAFLQHVLPGRDINILTPHRELLLQAFRFRSALRIMERRAGDVTADTRGRLARADDIVVPLDKFISVARGVGVVARNGGERGGVLRRVPLVVGYEGVALGQLGLVVACDALDVSLRDIRIERNDLIVGSSDRARRFRLDSDGSTLLQWHAPLIPDRWEASFTHTPVLRVLEVARSREERRENQKRLALAMARMVELRCADTPSEYADYVALVNERWSRRPIGEPDDPAQLARADEVEGAIRRVESDALVWLERAHRLWSQSEAKTADERSQQREIQRLWEDLATGRMALRIEEAHRRMAKRETELLAALRPIVADRICLVGYTASAMADMTSTPVSGAMPGVMAHANIINAVLQDRWPRAAAPAANALLILLCGLLVSTGACARGPWFGVGSYVVLAATVYAGGAVAFRASGYYLSTLPALCVSGATWSAVTLYRQITEERARRSLQRALAQYTAPAVARHIAHRVGRSALSPRRRRVTCFFADLTGFTAMSERLGPDHTRDVLNDYLVRLSRILTERGAMVNKFMGDGVFAFFNAPILECPDHAIAACAGADAVHAAMRGIDTVGAGDRGRPLPLRIGLATGEVFVGDYGSDAKLDYTCIGRTVNTAARLERANKAFGTRTMIDAATRAGAGDGFVFRSLGRIELAGLSAPCEAYELVGRAECVTAERRTAITQFEKAVESYQARDWEQCLRRLAACSNRGGSDATAALYQRACARYVQASPGPEWNGAITDAFAPEPASGARID